MSAELDTGVGEGGRLSGFDARLLEMAARDMSAEAIYKELGEPEGLSPARCLQRIRELLRATNYLSVVERMSLLLQDMYKLRETLWDRLLGTELKMSKHGDMYEVQGGTANANALNRVFREIRMTVESMQKNIAGAETAISHEHAQLLMAGISIMFDRYNARLEAHFRDTGTLPDGNEMRTMFEEVMPLGFVEIEGKELAA